jgi:hypothetical protein
MLRILRSRPTQAERFQSFGFYYAHANNDHLPTSGMRQGHHFARILQKPSRRRAAMGQQQTFGG